ncbi:TPA: transcription factor [Trebouxia sp. C0004]
MADFVSEHMGQGQAMPQQGIVQNADKNAGKGDQDQADLEASNTKQNHNSSEGAKRTVLHKPFNEMNIKKLTRAEKGELVDRVLQSRDADTETFLSGLKARMDRVGIDTATVQVRMDNLKIEADIAVGSRGNPTVTNTFRNMAEGVLRKTHLLKDTSQRFTILDTMSSILYPGRFTLLLGPPGAGKTTLLNALSGRLHKSPNIDVTGSITYNGKGFDQFRAAHTAAYVDQNDLHQPELTVRETFDFAARCQGVGHKADELEELLKREKEMGITPDPELDAYMRAEIRTGNQESIITDLIIKMLGLDVCSETLIGNEMMRGVSGGQRKRVTTGELLVGPAKAMFLDEISTGLDSSTTFQIVRSLRHFAHIREASLLTALLQPTPETYQLFDDIMLLSEGNLVFHGPREYVVPYFQSLGFYVPERKAVSDFLQEVTSKKDQKQYYRGKGKWEYMPVAAFAKAFQQTQIAQKTRGDLAQPYQAHNAKCEEALIQHRYALNGFQRWKALMTREFTLIKRTIVLYKAKSFQILVLGICAATLFLRTHVHPVSPNDGQEIAGFTFFGLLVIMVNGIAEMAMAVERLPVYWKQRRMMFFDAFSFAFPAALQRIPYSLFVSLIWTVVTYFPVGLSAEPSRFFMYWAIIFVTHQVGVTLFRCTAVITRNIVLANGAGMLMLLCTILLDGFVIIKRYIHPWTVWIYWMNPLQYAQKAILVNEFTGGHWQNKPFPYAPYQGRTLGDGTLLGLDMSTDYYWCWIGLGVNLAYILLLNAMIVALLAFLPAYGTHATVAKTAEELEDRRAALYGDEGTAGSDIVVNFQTHDTGFAGHSKGFVNGHSKGKDRIQSHSKNSLDEAEAGQLSRGHSLAEGLVTASSSSLGSQVHAQPAKQASSRRSLDSKGGSRKQLQGEGMVLPFEPMTMTFKDLHYWVQIPKESARDRAHVHMEGATPWLELLLGINGAFRPKVLTCLMGVTGAGKTTLMDVLAGRKTGYGLGGVEIFGWCCGGQARRRRPFSGAEEAAHHCSGAGC